MAEKSLNAKDSVVVIEEIESRLEKLFSKKKEEIERDLEDKMRMIKEEAEKRIQAIETEMEKGREILHEYKAIISEFESERASIQKQIKDHFDKAIRHQTEIEKMASLTLDELRQISELNRKLESLHQTTEDKINGYKKDLEERFGIVAEVPETKEEQELKINLEQELLKLRKIKELLESETLQVEEVEENKAPANESFVPTNEHGAPINVPEINEVMEGSLAQEAKAQLEEKAWGEEKENFRNLFEILEKYRKIEARNGNGEISFFQKDDRFILDGEYMVASIDESLEEAKRLYLKLSQTESPKEQFFIKQEIINHQEMLRKYILRNVKLCEKEGAVLPHFTEDILSLDILKDILEKLSMENWSNPADFSAFRTLVESLKDAYYAKITPPGYYLKSLIEELGV